MSWVLVALVFLPALLGLSPAALAASASTASCQAEWPLWRRFVERFVSVDGRVVDYSVPTQHSTSEGQSYGMFLALVANDRVQFDRFWQWSVDNLFGGDVGARLPAWQWGHRPDGTWGVIDPNSASDANLFFAQALFEAARLWQAPQYRRQAKALLDRVAAEEVVNLPGVGPMLLPGPQGFILENNIWRLNPSYLFVPQLRTLAREHPGPWEAIATNAVSLLETVAPLGLVANWVAYEGRGKESGLYIIDPVSGDTGSYDAIRVYLWAALTSPQDPLARRLMQTVSGMARLSTAQGWPPEEVYAVSGFSAGRGPVGFAAAIAPYLQRSGEVAQAAHFNETALKYFSGSSDRPLEELRYYDIVLTLFATGWLEGRYRFGASGIMQTDWNSACRSDETP